MHDDQGQQGCVGTAPLWLRLSPTSRLWSASGLWSATGLWPAAGRISAGTTASASGLLIVEPQRRLKKAALAFQPFGNCAICGAALAVWSTTSGVKLLAACIASAMSSAFICVFRTARRGGEPLSPIAAAIEYHL